MSLLKVWEVVDGHIAAIGGEGEAVGSEAVGDDYIAAAERGVIARGLAQRLMADGDVRLLTLDNNKRLSIRAYGYNIGALSHAINIDSILLNNLLGNKAAGTLKILHDMSAHPLLGCEHQPATTSTVEDLGTAIRRAARL